ncbi:putative secreted protein (Por secretion system target) [Ulvibacter sp. MAR_2010_11]|uniref:T9SS type A sorting domain-containing protein n=1 Tax=Ulvibacter sp. MAR_2010_11 TaxID=1250229 RepID=UPI000C2C510F|nr:T9SS type A sorting domain-containing protein [Ulvibacter sp. MAR_2010_11]PKA83034.1 putative secreted protein (Por secretion system target) [Ulvibacter sp. MAR_2010_11]
MKKIVTLLVFVSAGCFGQFMDDMESYTDGQPISQDHWTDADCGGGAGCAIISTSHISRSGSMSGVIPDDGTTDAILNLGNKIFGTWAIQFSMYVPLTQEATWIIKGEVPVGTSTDVGFFYFNRDNNSPGMGSIEDVSGGPYSFSFPHDTWFSVHLLFDINAGMGAATWQVYINKEEVLPPGTDFANATGDRPTSLGGINFKSISTDNLYYLDDFCYNSEGLPQNCFLGVEEYHNHGFQLYPNPMDTKLFIANKNQLAIEQIELIDVQGRRVIVKTDEFEVIDVALLDSGVFFLRIKTEFGVITQKIVKK